MSLSDAEIKILIQEAAERGARKALHDIGLHDDMAMADVAELRSLLDSWRSAKRTVGKTIIQTLTYLFLGALLAGSYFKFFEDPKL